MQKAAVIATATAAVVFAGIFTVPMVLIMGMAGRASGNACIGPPMLIQDAGGAVRVPLVGRWQTTSEWGMRRHPIRGDYSHHFGLDFTGASTVVAVKSGVVASTPTTSGEGNEIVLDHGAGVQTKYKHLASRKVKVGDKVWGGREIGVMGSTGSWSTGAHLHFEVWHRGRDVDPRPWLRVTARSGTGPPLAPKVLGALDVHQPDYTKGPDSGSTRDVVAQLPTSIGPYKGPQLVNAGLIIKAGQALDLDARTITIGVMTAMGESSLVNVDHGDAVGPDSRGLFQQRANGAWGSYADRTNPQIAATNFFKALLRVPNYRNLEPTIAAHRTQRNADPNHYAKYWPDALKVVAALTADPDLLTDLATDTPLEGCTSPGEMPELDEGDGSGQAIVAAAKNYVGTPYSWGGGSVTGPTRGTRTSPSLDGTGTVGFDCSGLVLFAVHHATQIQLEHSAEAQGTDRRGVTVPRRWADLQPGDVISFSDTAAGSAGTWNHVGIYAGNGQMVHAPRPGKTVEVVTIKGARYWEAKVWRIKRFARA